MITLTTSAAGFIRPHLAKGLFHYDELTHAVTRSRAYAQIDKAFAMTGYAPNATPMSGSGTWSIGSGPGSPQLKRCTTLRTSCLARR